ncbi:MAG: hypothetical protein KGZ83_11140 [Sulfuricella sp.]|nr:hypothetical protein [Sulfuricella sp.]
MSPFLETALPNCYAKEQAAELRNLVMAIRQYAGDEGWKNDKETGT